MRLLSYKIDSALLHISGAALTLLLAACSTPNPLMEDPAPVAAKETKPAPQAAATAAAAPGAAAPSAVPAPAQAPAPQAAQAPKPAPVVQPAQAATPAQATAATPATAAVPAATTAAPAAPAAAPAAPVAAAQAAAPGVETTRNRRFFGIFSPYRPDIQQGNFVSREMLAQLKEGMTPDQVRFVLGTPLLTDVFHAGRWDYSFRLQKGDGEVTTSRVTVFFKDGRLARIVGGDLPTEKDYLARLTGDAPPPKAPEAGAAAPSVPAEAAKAAATPAAAPK